MGPADEWLQRKIGFRRLRLRPLGHHARTALLPLAALGRAGGRGSRGVEHARLRRRSPRRWVGELADRHKRPFGDRHAHQAILDPARGERLPLEVGRLLAVDDEPRAVARDRVVHQSKLAAAELHRRTLPNSSREAVRHVERTHLLGERADAPRGHVESLAARRAKLILEVSFAGSKARRAARTVVVGDRSTPAARRIVDVGPAGRVKGRERRWAGHFE